MVARPGDFPWSSYRTNAEGEQSAIVTPHHDYLALGVDEADRARLYRTFFSMSLDDAGLDEIRKVTRGGFAFGSEEFKKQLAATAGRAMTPRRIRGLTPKPPLRV
jgi:putative transposase